ncbi:hypothetical protein HBI16_061280 [Parastagonospora nodorum]|nr:hypothetical protein HBI16_061280 [Parastagonospora nodorum]
MQYANKTGSECNAVAPQFIALPDEILCQIAGYMRESGKNELEVFCAVCRRFRACGAELKYDDTKLPGVTRQGSVEAHQRLLRFLDILLSSFTIAARKDATKPRINHLSVGLNVDRTSYARRYLRARKYLLTSQTRNAAKDMITQSGILISAAIRDTWFADLTAGESSNTTTEQLRATKGRQVGLLFALLKVHYRSPSVLMLSVDDGDDANGINFVNVQGQNRPLVRTLTDPFLHLFGVSWDSPLLDIAACFPNLHDLSVMAENFVPGLLSIPNIKTLRIHGLSRHIQNRYLDDCPEIQNKVTELEIIADLKLIVHSDSFGTIQHTSLHKLKTLLRTVPVIRTLRVILFDTYPNEDNLSGRYSHLEHYNSTTHERLVRSELGLYSSVTIDYPGMLQAITQGCGNSKQLTALELRTHCWDDNVINIARIQTLQADSHSLRSDFPALRHLVLPEHALVVDAVGTGTVHPRDLPGDQHLLYFILPDRLESLVIVDATVAIYPELLGLLVLRRRNGGLRQLETIKLQSPTHDEDAADMLCDAEILCEEMAISGIEFIFTTYLRSEPEWQDLVQLRLTNDDMRGCDDMTRVKCDLPRILCYHGRTYPNSFNGRPFHEPVVLHYDDDGTEDMIDDRIEAAFNQPRDSQRWPSKFTKPSDTSSDTIDELCSNATYPYNADLDIVTSGMSSSPRES